MLNTDPNHIHTYDKQGNITCCSLEEKIESKTSPITSIFSSGKDHDPDHSHDHNHDYNLSFIAPLFSLLLLLGGLILDNWVQANFFTDMVRILWYTMAYLPVGLPVIKEALQVLKKGEVFTEFFLMSIATIGAFAIGEYPEGVAVMLFYSIGELFQTAAVKKAKLNIRTLLDVRPDIAHVLRNGSYQTVDPDTVAIGEKIMIKAGEMIPLDGKLLSGSALLNTAALTGESIPRSSVKGEMVLAGTINLEKVTEVEVSKRYEESSVSRILHLVENATSRKAKTELLIRRLAKLYTPIVTYLAIGICFIPYFFVVDYNFQQWLYRALIFLVISCPCALVISIPLGYFGGLGAASRNGILFKGATYMDMLTRVKTLVMDKTGTLTKGVFRINKIVITNGMEESEFMSLVKAVEYNSTHPIARAITEFQINKELTMASDIKEFSGRGIAGTVGLHKIIIGNSILLEEHNIPVPSLDDTIGGTLVLVAINDTYAGHISISDELKEDVVKAIKDLTTSGIKRLIMLSGDKDDITQKVAHGLGLYDAKGGLLPEDKLNEVEILKNKYEGYVAFVGDGINDAPVLAASDIGIAMGAMGSDIAIETADVIIQADQPSKITTGIKISKTTQNIIWQNITLALGVKIIVLILGAGGIATMWEAVFADVGVALLAILNSVRIQRMKFD